MGKKREGREKVFEVTLKDLEVSFFSGKGAGGQHRNRHMNCVRLRHPETGLIAVGQSHRDRRSNLREALRALAQKPRFQAWCKARAREILGERAIEEMVEEMMKPENLKIEVRGEDGKWKVWEI